MYPAECGEQLGRDPSNIGSSKSLVLKSFSREGTLYFLRPHFPSPNFFFELISITETEFGNLRIIFVIISAPKGVRLPRLPIPILIPNVMFWN